MNHLYFGDCLDVLKELKAQHPQPFIDLIYIDPPFNSKRNYNVLFESIDMKDANAQKQAFADTWSNYDYVNTLNEMAGLHKDIYDVLTMFHKLKSISDSAVAYLTTMAIRIFYMHKLLKDTGSFYLHCDSTMSHYLKLMCDMIFDEKNFKNEIIWQRTSTHNDAKQGAKHFGRVSDSIFFYAKNIKQQKFNPIYRPYLSEYLDSTYNKADADGRKFKSSDLSAAKPGGNTSYEWKGIKPPSGRFWAYSFENMQEFEKQNRIYYSTTGKPYLKHYLDEMPGNSVDNIWTDIGLAEKDERLGYPTQKPEALLERIIKASSNEGDVVADFFCGCGTTIAAAQKLGRQWIGADISHLAIRLIVKRLTETYGLGIKHNIKIHGMPRDIASAKELAQNVDGGRISFQDWAIEVMLNGVVNEKKVADGGYDGYLTFNSQAGKQFALIETKSGNVNVKNVREFVDVVNTQKAAVGIFVCFKEQVTREMIKKAKETGHIKIEQVEFPQDKIQIITVEDLFEGKQPQLPFNADNQTFKKAKRNEDKAVSKGLFD